VEVFRADLFPAISANPFISFFTVAAESGVVAFNWTADNGETHTETATIAVD
jgi:sulfur-oxidizing protein SoxZ